MQGAGNRRSEMNRIKIVKASLTGEQLLSVLLSDTLELDDTSVQNTVAQHIQFEGADHDITGSSYGASIPVNSALSSERDVLVAYEMNGVPIPRDHGFPVRLCCTRGGGCS
ncbi:hypothetical protein OS493_039945 [Desmophyllum pertusum]|uniref:Oxidoreductase molybdopterin-binding domain-containing protein n=1 Tax=Desmophyllum pertusum TaxID=174260 RepID=A0A9W9Z5J1_9CNID|nr:hypothetical protein OS493_039945 [Desmophyllum pertusum]